MGVAAIRQAGPDDAQLLARLQLDMFASHPAYVEQLPLAVLATGLEQQTAAWAQRLASIGPVLLATEGSEAVGLTALGPPEQGPGEIELLLVLPRWTRRGHGGRLLAAASTQLREAGAIRGSVWALAGDPSAEAFLAGVDWHPDGSTRGFDTGEQVLTELRYTGPVDLLLI